MKMLTLGGVGRGASRCVSRGETQKKWPIGQAKRLFLRESEAGPLTRSAMCVGGNTTLSEEKSGSHPAEFAGISRRTLRLAQKKTAATRLCCATFFASRTLTLPQILLPRPTTFFFLFFLLIIAHQTSYAAVGDLATTIASPPPLAGGVTTSFNFDGLSLTDADPDVHPQWSLDNFSDIAGALRDLRQEKKTSLMRTLLRPILIKGEDAPQNQPKAGDFLHERIQTLFFMGFSEDAEALLTMVPKAQRTSILHEDAVLLMLAQNRRVDACAYTESVAEIGAKIRVFCRISVRDIDGAHLIMDLEGEQNPEALKDPYWVLVGTLLAESEENTIVVDSRDPLSVMLALSQKKSFEVDQIAALPVSFYSVIANASFMPMPVRIRAAEAGFEADILAPNALRTLYEQRGPFSPTELANPRDTLKGLESGLKTAFLWQWAMKNPNRLHLLVRLFAESPLSLDNLARLFEPVLQNTEALTKSQPSAHLIYALLSLGDQEQANTLWKNLQKQAEDQDIESQRELLKTWRYDALFSLTPRVSTRSSSWQILVQKMWEKTAYNHHVAIMDYVAGKGESSPVTTGLDVLKLIRALQTIHSAVPTRLTVAKHFSVLSSYDPEQKTAFARSMLKN